MDKKKSKPLTPGQKLFFVRIFPLIFIAAGIAGLYFSTQAISKSKASLEWPTAEGKIVSSSVKRSTRGKKRRTYYRADVSYEYSVDGEVYEGSRVSFSGTSSRNSSRAHGIVNKYPKGNDVAVYYEPGNPDECVLENSVGGKLYAGMGGCAFIAVVGIAMTIYLPKAARQQEEKDAMLNNA